MSLRRPLDVHLTLGGFTITSKASPNWTSLDVQFGRTYLVAFGPSNGRPLDALIGRPLVRNRRPLDVLRTSLCPLGCDDLFQTDPVNSACGLNEIKT